MPIYFYESFIFGVAMKNNTKSFLITVFFGFVIMGALIINIVPKNWILKINFWGMEALKNVVTTKYLYDAMFKYILRIRIKIYVVCMFFILTRFRKKAIFIFDAFLGFSWGTLLSELLSDYGVNGMRIVFFMLFVSC